MAPVDWQAVLAAVFAAKGAQELKASKAKKKALKAAAQQSSKSAEALEASLEVFLSRGEGSFELKGKTLVMTATATQQEGKKQKKKAKRAPEDGEAAAAEAAAEPAAEAPAAKKRKHKHTADEQQQHQHQQQQQNQQQQPRCAFDLLLAPPQDVQQPAAGGPAQQQQGKASTDLAAPKRRKPRPAAAAGAEATATPSGDLPDVSDVRWKAELKRTDVKSGPFSSAEKELIRQGVYEYAAAKGMSTDDMSWLFSTSKSGQTKGLWKQIAAKLPQRTVKSVWAAGTRMFHEGNYQGKWSSGEDSRLMELVQERGRKWKEIGGALGRMPEACRDRWLCIRLGDQQRKGPWDDEETERLRKAVEEYLAAKAAAEQGGSETLVSLGDAEAPATSSGAASGGSSRPPDRRVVLDDIDWNVISRAVRTRSNLQCLEKWYDQLSPSMVERGEWGPGDDRRLLRALYRSGVSHDYELEWDSLVQDRTAAQCRRRWRLMLKVLPDHRDMDFDQQVEELVDRYMPQLRGMLAGGQQAGEQQQQQQAQQTQRQQQAQGRKQTQQSSKEKRKRQADREGAGQQQAKQQAQSGKKAAVTPEGQKGKKQKHK